MDVDDARNPTRTYPEAVMVIGSARVKIREQLTGLRLRIGDKIDVRYLVNILEV